MKNSSTIRKPSKAREILNSMGFFWACTVFGLGLIYTLQAGSTGQTACFHAPCGGPDPDPNSGAGTPTIWSSGNTYGSCASVSTEYRSWDTYRLKVGFDTYTNSSPRLRYLVKDINQGFNDITNTHHFHLGTGGFTSLRASSSSCVTNAVYEYSLINVTNTCDTVTIQAGDNGDNESVGDGSYYETNSHTPTIFIEVTGCCYDADGIIIAHPAPSQLFATDSYDSNSRPDDPPVRTGDILTGCFSNTAPYTNWGVGIGIKNGSGYEFDLLSSEYTTAMLISWATADLYTCSTPPWKSGAHYDLTNHCMTGGANEVAFRNLSGDESAIGLGRFDHRFKVPTQYGMIYTVTWQTRTTTTNVTYSATNAEVIVGLGGDVYGQPHSVDPPGANGTVDIVNVRISSRPMFWGGGGGGPGGPSNCSSCPRNRGAGNSEGGTPSIVAGDGVGDGGWRGEFPPGPPPGVGDFWLGSVEMMWSLGRASFDSAAGLIYVSEDNPTNTLCTPASLKFAVDEGRVSVVTNAQGVLQQIDAPLCRVTVVSNAYAYDLKFFSKLSGQYQTNAYVTFTVTNIDGGAGSTNLMVLENRDGHIITNAFKYLGTNTWQLLSGNNLRGARATKIVDTNANTATYMREIFDPANSSTYLYREVEIYKTFPLGSVLLSKIVDPAGANLITTNIYDANGLLQQSILPSGAWDYYTYDGQGRTLNHYSAFGDQALTTNSSLCRLTSFDYTPLESNEITNDVPRTIISKIKGTEVGRSYTVVFSGEVRTYEAQTAGAAYAGGSGHLGTTNRLYTSGAFADEPLSVFNPDGTRQVIFYQTNSSYKVISTLSGQPDPGSDTNVLDGTRTVVTLGVFGETLTNISYSVPGGYVISRTVSGNLDEFHRPLAVTNLDGTYMTVTLNDCCNANYVRGREGLITTNTFDDLKRLTASIYNGIMASNTFDASGNVLVRKRIAGGQTINLSRSSYDKVGRLISDTNALGDITTFSYTFDSFGHHVFTSTQLTNSSSGVTRITLSMRDGTVMTNCGSGVHGSRYVYDIDGGSGQFYTKEIKLHDDLSDSAEWTQTFQDMLGRSYKLSYPDGASSASSFNASGQKLKDVDPDGVTTLYGYNAKGEMDTTAVRVDTNNASSTIDFAGTDRITKTVRIYTNNGVADVLRISTSVWATNGSGASNLTTFSERSTDGLKTWSAAYGLTNRTDVSFGGSGTRYVTNTAPDKSFSVQYHLGGRLQSATSKDALNAQISQTLYGYDAHGRAVAVTDARNGTTTTAFDDLDRRVATRTPAPGTGQAAQTTLFTYDKLGRIVQIGNPDGTVNYTEYFDSGEVRKRYGAREYPVSYAYDLGRMTNMTTWKAYPNSGAANTSWRFNERGFATNKVYDDANGPAYAFTPAGRLKSRTWARGIVTFYTNNGAGDLVNIIYTNSSSSSVTNSLDRLGRRTTVVDRGGTHEYTFNDAGLVLTETNTTGTLAGVGMLHQYDQQLRKTNVKVFSGSGLVLSHSYGFDSAGRVQTASDGSTVVGYSYLASSPLIGQIYFTNGGSVRMTSTKTYDYLNRLLRISSVGFVTNVFSSDYSYNDANQRTANRLADGSYWLYQYDMLGQVTSGKRYWSDGTPVAGQQFEYAFDDIGNRTSANSGGDASGGGLRSVTYGANNLNQYTNRINPSSIDILGIANAGSVVAVNGQNTYRKGEYYQASLVVTNSSTNVFQVASNIAVLGGTTNSTFGGVIVPKVNQTFTYDADGNLTNDLVFTYLWDDENRLIVATNGNIANLTVQRLDMIYDSMGRRLRLRVETNTGSAFVVTRDLHYVYDGWSLVAELSATNNGVVNTYLTGPDASLSRDGAGGVAGVLVVSNSSSGSHLVAYDGNGNVSGLVSTTTGTESAVYEYGPFGECIRDSGVAAHDNSLRFSTKYQDSESGLLFFGRRYLNQQTARWMSRDPLGEQGGANLFALVSNDAINSFDALGLVRFDYPDPDRSKGTASVANVDITLSADQLCSLSGRPRVTLSVSMEWIGLQNFNYAAPGLGQLVINGQTVQFPTPAPGTPGSTTTTATYTIPQPTCPSRQRGTGSISVVDLTRRGVNGWSGISQIYSYSWAYSCHSWGFAGPGAGMGVCVCVPGDPFTSSVTRTASNTVNPNL